MIDQKILEWFIPSLKEAATVKGDVPGHEFHGNQYSEGGGSGGGESESGGSGGTSSSGESSSSGSGNITSNTDKWRKGEYSPNSWSEVEAGKGDKFMLVGRGNENLMEMQVTKADPYRRFPVMKVTKIVNSNPKDREVAEHFLGRESGGEISLVDADVKYFRPIRRAKK